MDGPTSAYEPERWAIVGKAGEKGSAQGLVKLGIRVYIGTSVSSDTIKLGPFVYYSYCIFSNQIIDTRLLRLR